MSELDELLSEHQRENEIREQMAEESSFTVGEILLIRGCFFRITALTEGRMYLQHQGKASELLKRL
jgi:hypothetical protein